MSALVKLDLWLGLGGAFSHVIDQGRCTQWNVDKMKWAGKYNRALCGEIKCKGNPSQHFMH
jgi:hypothetical protein